MNAIFKNPPKFLAVFSNREKIRRFLVSSHSESEVVFELGVEMILPSIILPQFPWQNDVGQNDKKDRCEFINLTSADFSYVAIRFALLPFPAG